MSAISGFCEKCNKFRKRHCDGNRNTCMSILFDTIEALQQENERLRAEVQKLSKAKEEGRLVMLPCKVWELLQKYKELTEPQGDEAETYTTGYRNGHRNGQAELIAYLLQIDTGTREAAEKAIATDVKEVEF